MKNSSSVSSRFMDLVSEIPQIGVNRHAGALVQFASNNSPKVVKTIRDLPTSTGEKGNSGIVISAGPSVRRQKSIERILSSGYPGAIISTDGSYIACLRAGLIPDYVITLDPHPTRIVRWFGDPDFVRNSENDDYFKRQDLDVDFRKNSIAHNEANIALVNEHGHHTKAIVCTAAPPNVVERLEEAKLQMYWWNPLVDNPRDEKSLTRRLFEMNGAPCMNTGGTVGTAAWLFAATRLRLAEIGVVGMDYGYHSDTPIEKTQTYYELIEKLGTAEGIEDFFIPFKFPLTGEEFYTDPTYFWYRQNFLELFHRTKGSITYNCTEGGTLVDEGIVCIRLDAFLNNYKEVR